jgi:hypothetical protein
MQARGKSLFEPFSDQFLDLPMAYSKAIEPLQPPLQFVDGTLETRNLLCLA